jgi:FtsZ-interacting cell division protein ZipA
MIGDFQIALIGIVIAVIIIVFGYNRWQESKHRRNVERAFSEDRPDVLFDLPKDASKADVATHEKPRKEPELGNLQGVDDVHLSKPATAAAAASATMAAARANESEGIDNATSAPSPAAQRMTIDGINTQIDTIVLVRVQHDLRFADWQDLLQGCKSISRNIRWEGFNVADAADTPAPSVGTWEPLWANKDSSYQTLRGGLQLADRSGATEAVTIAKFAQVVATFANQFEGQIQKEDNDVASERALALDALCAQTDVEIALNIAVAPSEKAGVANNTGIAATKLRGLLQANGMQVNDKGDYVHRDVSGQVLFSIRNRDADAPTGLDRQSGNVQAISLVLDVPCTPNPVLAFNDMAGIAQVLASAMHGQVVDDNNKPLSFNGREQISQSVADIAAQLQARGFAAGSPVAKRLFS